MPNSQVPPEVLEDIFSQLSSSKSALYHLSLSCKIFYHICKPFLYPHITITTGEQRRRLKEVRKEDAQLVRKLVIRGQERSDGRLRMNGLDNSIGSGIIDDLFQGNLLDISVIEALHVSLLFENVNHQLNLEPLQLKAASNLVELSIRYHHGGGSLWTHVLGDDKLCPSLIRLGTLGVSSFRPYQDAHSEYSGSPRKIVGESGEYELESISLYHHSLGARLSVYAADCMGKEEIVEKDLVIVSIYSSGGYRTRLPRKIRQYARISMAFRLRLECLDADTWRQMLAELKRLPIKTPAFLSLPYSRSDFTTDILSICSSIESLGIELHFTRDEEEDSISVIPQSFVKFVEKQKKLKEEKEKLRLQERE